MMIGSGMPSSHNRMPRPKPMTFSQILGQLLVRRINAWSVLKFRIRRAAICAREQ
jgi:hypothetical protein